MKQNLKTKKSTKKTKNHDKFKIFVVTCIVVLFVINILVASIVISLHKNTSDRIDRENLYSTLEFFNLDKNTLSYDATIGKVVEPSLGLAIPYNHSSSYITKTLDGKVVSITDSNVINFSRYRLQYYKFPEANEKLFSQYLPCLSSFTLSYDLLPPSETYTIEHSKKLSNGKTLYINKNNSCTIDTSELLENLKQADNL